MPNGNETPHFESGCLSADLEGEANPGPQPEESQEPLEEKPVLPKFPPRPKPSRSSELETEWAPGRRVDLKKRKGGFKPGL